MKSPMTTIHTNKLPRRRRRMSLRTLLTLTLGGMVALSVGATLFLSIRSNFLNTFSLLNEQSIQLLNSMDRAIRHETERTEQSARALARLYGEGAFAVDDAAGAEPFLRTILLSEPAVEGLLIVGNGGSVIDLWRWPDGSISPMPEGRLQQRHIKAMLAGRPNGDQEPAWGTPVMIGQASYHSVSVPLRREGSRAGYVVAAIGGHAINRLIVDLGREYKTTAFVMTQDNEVLAHSRQPELFRDRQSIPVAEFPDAALRTIVDARSGEEFAGAAEQGVLVFMSAGREGNIFILKSLPGYSRQPYWLGAYFAKVDIGDEVFRILYSLLAGLLGLLLALAAAVAVGRRLSMPMSAVAKSATRLSRFELEQLAPLPGSRIAEIDRQSEALNRLRHAVLEFARYVPRRLVERVLALGDEATRTVEREVTILFSDIAHFTTLSEAMNASDTASTLNRHFDLLCTEIEARGGTVDKFMGDGVMAFWGAPDTDVDHATHAVEAARSIMGKIRTENKERKIRNLSPLNVRIGIHTGRVVIGNIGGGSRQNYTIVGDAVNVAQRLEQLGKRMMPPDTDCIVVVSDSVVAQVPDKDAFLPAGTRQIRGREKRMSVYLVKEAPVSASRGGGAI